MIHLFPTNILQPTVQITDALHNILYLVLILRLDLARLTNGNIERHPDRALGTGQPAASGGVCLGREAETVLAGVSSGEGKAAGVILALGDDAVVVVEGLVDGDKHLEVWIDGIAVGVWVDDLGLELACSCRKWRG